MTETWSDKGAECPYCGYLHNPKNDNFELYSEDCWEWDCHSCSKTFNVSVYAKYSWTCQKSNDDKETSDDEQ